MRPQSLVRTCRPRAFPSFFRDPPHQLIHPPGLFSSSSSSPPPIIHSPYQAYEPLDLGYELPLSCASLLTAGAETLSKLVASTLYPASKPSLTRSPSIFNPPPKTLQHHHSIRLLEQPLDKQASRASNLQPDPTTCPSTTLAVPRMYLNTSMS